MAIMSRFRRSWLRNAWQEALARYRDLRRAEQQALMLVRTAGPHPDPFPSTEYGATAVNSIRQQRAAAVIKRWVTQVEQSFDYLRSGPFATKPLKTVHDRHLARSFVNQLKRYSLCMGTKHFAEECRRFNFSVYTP